MENEQKKIILCGIAGGIAVYKTVEAVSRLGKAGFEVHAVMTPAAQRFVTPLTFQAVLGRSVGTTLFCNPQADDKTALYPHLYPAGEADAYLVMPATADIISKLAHGQADDLVCASALGLSSACPRFFCPAMNTNMWNQPVVQQNVKRLLELGWIQIGPETGHLACGTSGEGRLVEASEIADQVIHYLEDRDTSASAGLKNKRVLILSGPTREHFDPVRYIGNPSSGRMGRALANEAVARGATVHFVTGPVTPENLPVHSKRLSIYHVTGAEEMLHTATRLFDESDIVIFAAAVADYMPRQVSPVKRSKEEQPLVLELKPTPDIAATLCKNKNDKQTVIGFALQDENAHENARSKLVRKNFDMIILNKLSAMGAAQADFECLVKGGNNFEPWGMLTKDDCARKIFDCLMFDA